jgi:hypothetical protein
MKLSVSLLLGSVLAAGTGCSKASEPAPSERAGTGPAEAGASDTGRPVAGREPEWTFNPDDPAKDYVGRYIKATVRYGPETACILLSPSTFKNGDSVVEVRNPADGSCGKPAELRDRFIANVSTDRLRIDDPEHHAALKAWPDGSTPGTAAAPVAAVPDLHKWKTPLHDAVKAQQLYPLRVQLYGRGTYPVVTLAGWHALFDPKGDLAALKGPAQELCTATNGLPVGFFAEPNRTMLLRVDCPDNPHWEKL